MSPPSTPDYNRPFTRGELRSLIRRARFLADNTPSDQWSRVYTAVETSLDHLDATIARSRAYNAQRPNGTDARAGEEAQVCD